MQEKGNISIHTENIFPIIKKFLYSDNEIFLRELVSNAVDAVQKIKRLASLGQYNGALGEPEGFCSLSTRMPENHNYIRQWYWYDGRGDQKIHQPDSVLGSRRICGEI